MQSHGITHASPPPCQSRIMLVSFTLCSDPIEPGEGNGKALSQKKRFIVVIFGMHHRARFPEDEESV